MEIVHPRSSLYVVDLLDRWCPVYCNWIFVRGSSILHAHDEILNNDTIQGECIEERAGCFNVHPFIQYQRDQWDRWQKNPDIDLLKETACHTVEPPTLRYISTVQEVEDEIEGPRTPVHT